MLNELPTGKVQNIFIYNSTSKSVVNIESSSVTTTTSTYTKQSTDESGATQITTNSIPSVTNQFPDFTNVITYMQSISNISLSNIDNVQVTSSKAVNTYTLTVNNQQSIQTVVISSEPATNHVYLSNFEVKPMPIENTDATESSQK